MSDAAGAAKVPLYFVDPQRPEAFHGSGGWDVGMNPAT